MSHRLPITLFTAIIAMVTTHSACADIPAVVPLTRDHHRDSLELGGAWQCVVGQGDAPLWEHDAAAALTWEDVTVPGQLPGDAAEGWDPERRRQIDFVWARRTFTLTPEQARRGAALRWGGIRFGAAAWLNGTEIGRHAPIGPHAILIPDGLARPGENTLLLRIPGWAGVARSKSGFTLMPTGSGKEPWGAKTPAIYDEIFLEFHDGLLLRDVLAVPDLANSRVILRVRPDALNPLPAQLTVSATVTPADSDQTAGHATAALATDELPLQLAVPIENVQPWTPHDPFLYTATVEAALDGRVVDRVTFHFGMREIAVIDGRFALNGKPLWLRGSNLVFEWLWGDVFRPHAKRYLVDEARRMNLNSFRTHTLPPPADWLHVTDQHGTMILAELPVLYNHARFSFTPEEQEIFNANALLDARGWLGKLGNHPSIILWVLTNESPREHEQWEAGPYYDFVRQLDPTRPAMRSGPEGERGTPDVLDIHTCWNWAAGVEGGLIRRAHAMGQSKDADRALSNSEYMNVFGWEKNVRRWLGDGEHPDGRLVFAEFMAEHTEAMRRYQFDCILPYMYAGWTGMRGATFHDDFPSPMAAALHSVMAPVFASLDLFDRNFIAGSSQTTPLVLINETLETQTVAVDLYLTPLDPQFVPRPDALDAAVWHARLEAVLEPDSVASRDAAWAAPDQAGVYFLAAVLRREGRDPVVSQRVVRSVPQPTLPPILAEGRPVAVLGADPAARFSFRELGLTTVAQLPADLRELAAVVVWDAGKITPQDQQRSDDLLAWVRDGGCVLVMEQESWTWPQLIDWMPSQQGDYLKGESSRVFSYAEADHPALRGIDPRTLQRWNGLPGRIADRSITGPAAEQGRKLLWMEDDGQPVLVAVPMEHGQIILSQLHLKQRLSTASRLYDPAACQLFLNLLTPPPDDR